jgi:hypothetical protein
MTLACIVVSNATPLVQEEIQQQGGTVRRICEHPLLHLVQIPHDDWIWIPKNEMEGDGPSLGPGNKQPTCKIGTKDGQGYLLIRPGGWLCEYQQHASDITRTSLRSLDDPPLLAEAEAWNKENEDKEGDWQEDENEEGDWDDEDEDEEMDQLSPYELAIIELIKKNELSPYQRSLWSLAQDPTTFAERPALREAFQARITLSSYASPAVREAINARCEELAALPEQAANFLIIDIVNTLLSQAEACVSALSEEDNHTINQMKCAHQLHVLRTTMLTVDEILWALQDFGDENYQKARPEVEQLLTHPIAEIREHALNTLIMGWHLYSVYKETAFSFLNDPDPECRRQGMRCLNPWATRSRDRSVVTAYARCVANPNEQTALRLSAYSEFLTAIGDDLHHDYWEEIENFLEDGGTLEQAPHLKWSLVRLFLEEDTAKQAPWETTLVYSRDTIGEQWIDQDGYAFTSLSELSIGVLQKAHALFRLRFPSYTMILTLSAADKGKKP